MNIFFSTFYFVGEKTIYSIVFLNFEYTIGLNFYISGIVLILISDYIPDAKNKRKGISGFDSIVLNILTGGIGFSIFGNVFSTFF